MKTRDKISVCMRYAAMKIGCGAARIEINSESWHEFGEEASKAKVHVYGFALRQPIAHAAHGFGDTLYQAAFACAVAARANVWCCVFDQIPKRYYRWPIEGTEELVSAQKIRAAQRESEELQAIVDKMLLLSLGVPADMIPVENQSAYQTSLAHSRMRRFR